MNEVSKFRQRWGRSGVAVLVIMVLGLAGVSLAVASPDRFFAIIAELVGAK